MGNALSGVRYAVSELLDNVRGLQTLKERIATEPGLPVENPTRSFWMSPPSPIARHVSDLPQRVDVVVIGSGITGTSVAKTLFDHAHLEGRRPAVLMLEARDACSGATGRNGGHVAPVLYHDYATFKRDHGDVSAQRLVNFRLAHLHELGRAAEEEGVLDESQWRQVEAVDAYYNQELFKKAKAKVQAFHQALPSELPRHHIYESMEAMQRYNLASDVVGCIASSACAIHPYNFVTGILSKLLSRYPGNFFLCTNTPCTSITEPSSTDPLYTVVTPKGSVKTLHVVHATNGWSSQLLKSMRGKIIPFRGYMTTQRPGRSIPAEMPRRSFVFYEIPVSFDYLTQLPNGEREFMLGGGFAQEGDDTYEGIANTDDSGYNKRIIAYLGGVLPRYLGEDNWGCEGQASEEDTWFKGRVKASWSGILGMSADLLPWVGRLPPTISGRSVPSHENKASADETFISAPPGEWIAAGFSGEGMVHAWMSGKALADMVLGREGDIVEWFPEILRVSKDRWKRARPEGLLDLISKE